MAITLSDFDNIWASSSPLTPYSFTDANYKEGWNFIGSTPPSRQMWDFLQKNNDEKQQYIVNNFLPLSGGTITGTLTIGTDAKARGLMAQNGTSCFRIASGEFSYADSGAYIHLFSKTADNNAGNFQISAHDSSDMSLIGKPDGTLTWNGKSITERSFGVVIAGNGTYSFTCNESGAVIFAKRGAACAVHMVDYWTSGSVKIFEAGSPITITKSANDNDVTITNNSSVGMVIKIINGDAL